VTSKTRKRSKEIALARKLDESIRRVRDSMGLYTSPEISEMTKEQLQEHRRNLERIQRKTRDWQNYINGLIAIERKVISHRNYKHEGCCMHFIEDMLLDYGLLDARGVTETEPGTEDED
jgi:hypothetical protein